MIDAFLSILFLLAALGILGGLLLVMRSLRTEGRPQARVPADGGPWATATSVLVLVGLVAATVALLGEKAASTPSLVVKLTGYQFGWRFEYFQALPAEGRRSGPDQLRSLGISTTDHLVLPLGSDTVVLATSTDVIHRLEVPELKVKRDLIPGLVSRFPLHPARTGEFLLLSDGLCGATLGLMAAPLTVLETGAFQRWLDQQRALSKS